MQAQHNHERWNEDGRWPTDFRIWDTQAMRFLSFIIISHISQMSVTEISNPEPPTARDQKKKKSSKIVWST